VPAPAATQVAGQSSHSTQTADANADATQIAPTNTSIGVRIGSEGSDGPVEQSNDAIALAGALNGNETTQGLTQSQGGSGKQIAGQSAKNDQSATAHADATQVHPTNTNISVRIFSPGNDGPVSQSNTAIAGSLAGNANATTQTVDQTQGGGGSGGGTQIAGQKADNEQTAHANADATQVHPKNTNISVRIFSEGDNGPVSQSNTAAAGALAGNLNATTQSTKQSQAGAAPVDRCASTCTAPSGAGLQVAGQSASNVQCACADATATQIAPSNDNQSIRIGSPGADGPVTQSNTALALAGALNGNSTSQTIGQSQGGSGGTAVQAVGQKATNDQHADADADAFQAKPSNLNVPVRIWSGGAGGSVEQSNAALAGSLAANLNGTTQSVEQAQGGSGGTGVQAAGQLADSHQSADADADATQCCAANVNAPVRIFSWGDDGGEVSQSNLVGALALGLNANETTQTVTQAQTGAYGGTAVQAAGQKADNDQHADADADATQAGALNLNAPLRIGTHDRCEKRDTCDERDRCNKRNPCERPEKHGSNEPSSYEKGRYDTPGSNGERGGYDKRDGYDKPDCYEKRGCYDEPSRLDERDCSDKHDPCKRVDPCVERDPCKRYDPCREQCQRSPCEDRCPEPRKEVYER
jgi:hypothetical protein